MKTKQDPQVEPYDKMKPYKYAALSEIAIDGLEARDNRPLEETISIAHNGITHAVVPTNDILTGPEAISLAHVLAAAPDLLAAAKNALEWMELALPKFDGPLDVGNETHQIALRAAIAKAEGR